MSTMESHSTSKFRYFLINKRFLNQVAALGDRHSPVLVDHKLYLSFRAMVQCTRNIYNFYNFIILKNKWTN